jgi:HK97 family phage prohead protease
MIIVEHVTGRIDETQEATRNGQPVGRVSGLLTTFKPDRPFDSRALPERFESGAFEETLKTHRERNNRPIRMLLEHDPRALLGGFPIDMVNTNSEGLHATGEINLNTQLGQETFALAQQGVLSDFSISYTVTESHDDNGSLIADSIELFEASIVGEPANQGARITSLESLTTRELEHILMGTHKFTRTMARAVAAQILEVEEAAVKQVEEDALRDFMVSMTEDPDNESEESLISQLREWKDSL